MIDSSLQQHPLSDVWPSMPVHVFEQYGDGIRPPSKVVVDALLASAWFKGLKKSQRVAYASNWFHFLKRGSNQYRQTIRTDTVRYSAELAQAAASREARA